MRWYTITGIVTLVVVVLCAGALAFLFSVDLSRYKTDVEAAVSEATGREFTIAGKFEPKLSLRPSLVAKDITFANAAWSKEPRMVHIDRFAIELDLWSLIRGPIVIHDLEIDGARIRLETDAEQGTNWELAADQAPEKATEVSAVVPVVVENLELRDAVLVMATDQQLVAAVDEFSVHPADSGLLDIKLLAALNDRPIAISGQIGPFENLVRGENVRLDLAGTLGKSNITAKGNIADVATLGGVDLALELTGTDLQATTDTWGLPRLGSGAWYLKARAAESERGVDLALEADISKFDAQVEGYVDDLLAPKTMDFNVTAVGPDLGRLGQLWGVKGLPNSAFRASGRLQHIGQQFEFSEVKAEVADTVLTLQGTLGDPPDLTGTDINFSLSGANLSEYSTLAGISFAAKPFQAKGRLVTAPQGLEVKDFTAAIGENRLAAQGTIGVASGLVGTDLKLDTKGPDLSALPAVSALVDVGAEPFEVNGRLQVAKRGYRLDKMQARLGSVDIQVNGLVGQPPTFDGTNIDFKASGENLAAVSKLTGLTRPLPEEDFEVSGHFDGTPQYLSLKKLTARTGKSDLTGELVLDIRGKPDLKGELTARHLDLVSFSDDAEEEQPAKQKPVSEASDADTPGDAQGFVFSDQPLDLSALNEMNIDLRVTIKELTTVTTRVNDIELGVNLRDGALRLEPIDATGRGGGRITGRVRLDPAGEGYGISADLNTRQARLGLLSAADVTLENQPASDITVVFKGHGKSLHDIMSSSNGRLQAIQSKGRIANSKLGLLAADVLVEVFKALNPFAKKEPYTMLQCGVYVIKITDGVAKLDPFAMETDKMLMIGTGSVTFATEKLDLNWTTKPREGIGLSATALTNPYIKLSGTLASPALGIKPVHATAAAGAAVATAGLSILAQGIWDRVSAERDLCKQAIEALEEQKRDGKKKQRAKEPAEEIDADEGD
ncbi:MAG: AsmA family protein [Pseudomonadota bacterium]|nr:MAG: AsmA family protein [Pseudomonadota bacterium]